MVKLEVKKVKQTIIWNGRRSSIVGYYCLTSVNTSLFRVYMLGLAWGTMAICLLTKTTLKVHGNLSVDLSSSVKLS